MVRRRGRPGSRVRRGVSVRERVCRRALPARTAGAGLLGFVAGEMAVTDPAVHDWFHGGLERYELAIALVGAAFVIVLGTLLARRVAAGNFLLERSQKILERTFDFPR